LTAFRRKEGKNRIGDFTARLGGPGSGGEGAQNEKRIAITGGALREGKKENRKASSDERRQPLKGNTVSYTKKRRQ